MKFEFEGASLIARPSVEGGVFHLNAEDFYYQETTDHFACSKIPADDAAALVEGDADTFAQYFDVDPKQAHLYTVAGKIGYFLKSFPCRDDVSSVNITTVVEYQPRASE